MNLSLSAFYESLKNDEQFIKGMIAYEEKDFELVSQYFTMHLESYLDDAVTWFRLGNSFNQIGRGGGEGGVMNKKLLYAVLECFDYSISLDTNYLFSIRTIAALIHSILGNINEAKSYAFRAYTLNSKISFTNYVNGKVANEAKEYDLAIEFLSAAIEKANQMDKENYLHQWYLERVIAHSILNNSYNAEQDYLECLKLNPANYDCYFQFGIFLGNRNRKNEACVKFRYLYNFYLIIKLVTSL